MNALYRDVRLALPFLVQLWMLVTPVVYTAPSVLSGRPHWVALAYALNPMVGVVEGFRWALLGSAEPAALAARRLRAHDRAAARERSRRLPPARAALRGPGVTRWKLTSRFASRASASATGWARSDRSRGCCARGAADAQADELWALRDVSFDVARGEAVGIVGRNGAGKSTLLKILARITEPTTGSAAIHGRVGSLLEVGTGFHPELTGRENVCLNGAILGMRKHEIDARFDEIVEFSGVSRFLDTPVKRYSSGMRVRLAFAVAAHLEPEILIVDEVLAVGDAEFQSRCLGKMSDVAGHGRTVLFVSHNLAALRALCTRAVWLERRPGSRLRRASRRWSMPTSPRATAAPTRRVARAARSRRQRRAALHAHRPARRRERERPRPARRSRSGSATRRRARRR